VQAKRRHSDELAITRPEERERKVFHDSWWNCGKGVPRNGIVFSTPALIVLPTKFCLINQHPRRAVVKVETSG